MNRPQNFMGTQEVEKQPTKKVKEPKVKEPKPPKEPKVKEPIPEQTPEDYINSLIAERKEQIEKLNSDIETLGYEILALSGLSDFASSNSKLLDVRRELVVKYHNAVKKDVDEIKLNKLKKNIKMFDEHFNIDNSKLTEFDYKI